MALLFKEGVKLLNLQPQMLIALQVVQEEFARYSLDTVVTSGNDSTHKEGSLHYSGRALDFRIKHAVGVVRGIFLAIQRRLSPIGFDVLREYIDTPDEHLHVEYDPK